MEHLLAWAQTLGLAVTDNEHDDIVRLRSDDVDFAIVEHHALLVVEAASTGDVPFVLGAVDTLDDAERMLAMQLGVIDRRRQQLPRLDARRLPPGFVIEQAPTSTIWLSWFTGSAEFPDSSRGHARAVGFSFVGRAPVELIQASYQHPAGHPLFDAA